MSQQGGVMWQGVIDSSRKDGSVAATLDIRFRRLEDRVDHMARIFDQANAVHAAQIAEIRQLLLRRPAREGPMATYGRPMLQQGDHGAIDNEVETCNWLFDIDKLHVELSSLPRLSGVQEDCRPSMTVTDSATSAYSVVKNVRPAVRTRVSSVWAAGGPVASTKNANLMLEDLGVAPCRSLTVWSGMRLANQDKNEECKAACVMFICVLLKLSLAVALSVACRFRALRHLAEGNANTRGPIPMPAYGEPDKLFQGHSSFDHLIVAQVPLVDLLTSLVVMGLASLSMRDEDIDNLTAGICFAHAPQHMQYMLLVLWPAYAVGIWYLMMMSVSDLCLTANDSVEIILNGLGVRFILELDNVLYSIALDTEQRRKHESLVPRHQVKMRVQSWALWMVSFLTMLGFYIIQLLAKDWPWTQVIYWIVGYCLTFVRLQIWLLGQKTMITNKDVCRSLMTSIATWCVGMMYVGLTEAFVTYT